MKLWQGEKKKSNGAVKTRALVSISTYIYLKKFYLNICPELRMNPSATFMSFMKLGNIFILFSNSWVIIEVINEVVYITCEQGCSGIKWSRGRREEKRDWPGPTAGLKWCMVTSFFPADGMQCQVSWEFLPPLEPPAVDSQTPLHIWLLVSLSLYFRSPWKVELQLFWCVLKCWDNTVSVGTKVLYVNRVKWDVPMNSVCVQGTRAHVEAWKTLCYIRTQSSSPSAFGWWYR